ncbi:MAG TPA: hydrogenase maturation nickel metallochaperone HypA [Candidatus Omnitrophota bacterium]|nr:hydrogenase maturation nickel metallochaperone HypA [Candidatus Omnitrophota bacterium]
MHDIMFSKEIVRQISERLKTIKRGKKIVAVSVGLSPLCHVTAKTLSEAFKQMVDGTELNKISLDIRPLPVRMRCNGCGSDFEILKPTFSCGVCGNSDIAMIDNREFIVESFKEEGS